MKLLLYLYNRLARLQLEAAGRNWKWCLPIKQTAL